MQIGLGPIRRDLVTSDQRSALDETGSLILDGPWCPKRFVPRLKYLARAAADDPRRGWASATDPVDRPQIYETEGHWFETSRARSQDGPQERMGIAMLGGRIARSGSCETTETRTARTCGKKPSRNCHAGGIRQAGTRGSGRRATVRPGETTHRSPLILSRAYRHSDQ